MKKSLRMVLTLAVVCAMAVSFAGCGGNDAKLTDNTKAAESTAQTSTAAEPTAEPAAKEVVTLKLVEVNNMGGIDNTDAVTQELNKKLGINIEYTDTNEEKFKVLLAGNDIGDIVNTSNLYEKQMVDGGMVIPLDDLLNTNGKDVLQNCKTLLDYSKAKLSFGQDKLFFLPAHGFPNLDDAEKYPVFEYACGPYVRWDYYQELGSPAVNSPDDYLKLLADMQKKHPKTADGKKTYPLALHTEWDGWSIFKGGPPLNYGYWGLKSVAAFFNTKGEVSTVLDENNFFWTTMDFFYKAQKMGLLDPDSFTQKYANLKEKIKNGQVFTNNNSWDNGELNPALAKAFGPAAGMGLILGPYPACYKNAVSPVGWGDAYASAITKNCKNPDRAMDLLNYLRSYEGARLVYSGVKDVHWTVVDGKPALKDETIKMKLSDTDFTKKTGIYRLSLDHLCGLDKAAVDPADGTLVDLFALPKALAATNNDFQKAYCASYQVDFPGAAVDKMAEQGKIEASVYNTLAADLMPQLTDDEKRINAQIKDYVIKLYPKAVYAKTDAAYADIVKAAKAELKKLGADTLAASQKAAYEKAKTEAATYGK